jgi:hypothetical protein
VQRRGESANPQDSLHEFELGAAQHYLLHSGKKIGYIMETAMEEETYGKVILIIMGILSLIVFIIVIDVMTGHNLFKSLSCSMLWYLGSLLPGYLNCGGIAI